MIKRFFASISYVHYEREGRTHQPSHYGKPAKLRPQAKGQARVNTMLAKAAVDYTAHIEFDSVRCCTSLADNAASSFDDVALEVA
jgi:hypothetical protein